MIESRQLRLARELMKQGSNQVEMSNEGLMTEEVEDRLRVVIAVLRSYELPACEGIAWCSTMLENGRVGFMARKPMEALRSHGQRTVGG